MQATASKKLKGYLAKSHSDDRITATIISTGDGHFIVTIYLTQVEEHTFDSWSMAYRFYRETIIQNQAEAPSFWEPKNASRKQGKGHA